jgi:glycosyltransferase involved in cell wall biosynthesis
LARDGDLPGFSPSRSGSWLLDRLVEIINGVDHVVCVSEATKRDLLHYYDVEEDRVSVIYNAVFQAVFPTTLSSCLEIRRRLEISEESPILLHVGTGFYKNRETVLEVASKLARKYPNLCVVFVGALSDALAAQAIALGVASRLRVLNDVTREELAAIYTAASVLLFPSIYEGFGYPVLEAQICGTPVVCSHAGSLPEVAADQTRMFDPHDVEGMAGMCESYCETQTQYSWSLPDRFSFESWVSSHKDIYERLKLSS